MINEVRVPFLKCHGNGNDFVLIDEMQGTIIDEEQKEQFCQEVSNYEVVGCEGILFVSKTSEGLPMMRFFNPDGSESEMSGNGIRCVSRFSYDTYYKETNPLIVDTLTGKFITKNLMLKKYKDLHFVEVAMEHISLNTGVIGIKCQDDTFINKVINVPGYGEIKATAISMGNPHLVIYIDDLTSVDLIGMGHAIENHDIFRNRINVNFVQKVHNNKLIVQTHERGAGFTLSCGSGMTASAVVHSFLCDSYNDEEIEIHTAGGVVWVTLNAEDNSNIKAKLLGSVVNVYEAEIIVTYNNGNIKISNNYAKGVMYLEEITAYGNFRKCSDFNFSILENSQLSSVVVT